MAKVVVTSMRWLAPYKGGTVGETIFMYGGELGA